MSDLEAETGIFASPFFFEATPYWSQGDEQAHFEWLYRIACVKGTRGRGRKVFLAIDLNEVTQADRVELEAVYRRYGGDLNQLQTLGENIHASN